MSTYRGGRWQGLRLKNFRRFEDTGSIHLAPITLLLGKNSSGKTSLLRSMLLGKQLVLSQGDNDVTLVGPEVDFGAYKEVVHAGELRRDVHLCFQLDNVPVRRRLTASARETVGPFADLFESADVNIGLHWNARAARTQLESITISDPWNEKANIFVKLERHGPHEFTLQSSFSPGRRVQQVLSLADLRLFPIDLSSRRSNDLRHISLGPEEYFIYSYMQELASVAQSLVHIGPLREVPDRAYRVDQIAAPGSTASVVEVLDRQKAAQARVAASLRSMGMARDVSLIPLAPGYVGIALTDSVTGRVDNLADVGFGVSQVLPILATLATAPPRSTVLIEQPELHLHPDAQGRLADELILLSRERNSSLIMESHSEHIMLRLQRRVAEGNLDPTDLAIYIVDDGLISKVRVDRYGRLDSESMPDGFFEEEWEDAVNLARAAAQAR
ncbi:hypothetical protein E1263_25330 [Kribbella antibiotica]|uniref:DUF3696 domain-containing protein n=1 Tax=Kribbella antibiotica TaxID=190195 RepID=A0A4R4ZFL2_9ACTN|nr:AAA family ATPase [Kribbella antibiotica]TDD56364.1 hypothetical protein E1263_25330 [Kribbella antibiotica]